MAIRDLIPWTRSSDVIPVRYGERDPFLTLHREMNRLFDEVLRSFPRPSFFGDGAGWPNVEISENDKEYRIAAELPGMEQKDIDVTVAHGQLIIRGEKKAETRDDERRFSERYYGSFERRIPLGDDVDPEGIKATFKNGLLTVNIPKSEQAQRNVRRITISG
jgi:HSP20 family protein